VVVLGNAGVVMHGDGREVFSHVEELAAVGLDIPQITQLMRMLRQRGLEVPDNVYTVEEALSVVRSAFEKLN
jgi:hypothetical protein